MLTLMELHLDKSLDIIIECFVSEAPSEIVIAPKLGLKNFEFVAKVEKKLAERNTWQGRPFM